MSPQRIIWQKWIDPFIAAMDEFRDKYTDSYAFMERPGQTGVYEGPAVMGPAGIVPLNELNSPSRNFNLWVGHSSTLLTQQIVDRVKTVPGVEILKIWTPYRFWLGVGKAFEEDTVKREVMRAVFPAPEKENVSKPDTLADLKKHLARTHKFWAIFELKSGKFDVSGSESRAVIEHDINKKRDEAKRVIASWEEVDQC